VLSLWETLYLIVMGGWISANTWRLIRYRWIPQRKLLLAVEALAAVGLVCTLAGWTLLGFGWLVLFQLLRVALWGSLFQGGADVVVFWAGITILVSLAFPNGMEQARRIFVGVFLVGYALSALHKGWGWGSHLVKIVGFSSYPVRTLSLSESTWRLVGNFIPVLQLLAAAAMGLGPPLGYFGLLFWLGFHGLVGWTFGLWRFAWGYGLVLAAWFLLHNPIPIVRP
jgi:hypothetical protein